MFPEYSIFGTIPVCALVFMCVRRSSFVRNCDILCKENLEILFLLKSFCIAGSNLLMTLLYFRYFFESIILITRNKKIYEQWTNKKKVCNKRMEMAFVLDGSIIVLWIFDGPVNPNGTEFYSTSWMSWIEIMHIKTFIKYDTHSVTSFASLRIISK